MEDSQESVNRNGFHNIMMTIHSSSHQVSDYPNYKPENEDYDNLYTGTENLGGENGERSRFNAGGRVGVGIGLSICVGIGIGVSLLPRTYQGTCQKLQKAAIIAYTILESSLSNGIEKQPQTVGLATAFKDLFSRTTGALHGLLSREAKAHIQPSVLHPNIISICTIFDRKGMKPMVEQILTVKTVKHKFQNPTHKDFQLVGDELHYGTRY
ncbi:hypothetical protein CsSME_00037820 [Camellia sinensis var. sinensis]